MICKKPHSKHRMLLNKSPRMTSRTKVSSNNSKTHPGISSKAIAHKTPIRGNPATNPVNKATAQRSQHKATNKATNKPPVMYREKTHRIAAGKVKTPVTAKPIAPATPARAIPAQPISRITTPPVKAKANTTRFMHPSPLVAVATSVLS